KDPALSAPIKAFDDLLVLFHETEKPAEKYRIGAEMEKPGVFKGTAAALPYDGEKSVLRVLEELECNHGWKADRENPGGPLIALLRNHASVTLEPGGQLELSGAPLVDVHEVCTEFREHMSELHAISEKLGLVWLGIGFHPFAARADLPWVPKDRYKIMREYLPTRGGHALDMMLRTSTVQANYDYSSEADAMQKMRVSLKLSPLTTAIFANSPWVEGAPHGGVSYRAKVWLDVDPDRSGLVEALWKPGAGYKDYVEWALDVPMFLVKRDGKILLNTGQTFRDFWKDGFEGVKPNQGDWQTHLNTIFPEVRLKRTIEVRGADAQCARLACALPALWTGLFYDQAALDEADAMTKDWDFAEVNATRQSLWKLGLKTKFRATTFRDLAVQLIDISERGLERRARKSATGKDERVHLTALRELVHAGKTPGDLLLEQIDPTKELRPQILELTNLERPLSPPRVD
ncbi:MAG: glutamate--cysteine ligase, partial [Polyangiaceae bacterium]